MAQHYHDYLRQVERFYTVVRFSGFMLAPRDVEKVQTWFKKGVGLHLVLQGLLDGCRAHRRSCERQQVSRLPHNMSYYARFVSARVKANKAAHLPVKLSDWDLHATSGGRTASTDDEGSNKVGDPRVVFSIEHLLSEARLLAETETRLVERQAKDKLTEELTALLLSGGSGCATLEDLRTRLVALDDKIIDFYDASLEPEARAQVEQLVTTALAAEPEMGARARTGRIQVLRRRTLHERLGMPVLYQ